MLSGMAIILVYTGRTHEAIALLGEAMRLDPHHPAWYWCILGIANFVLARYQEAIGAIRHRPSLAFLWHAYLAACHAQLGDIAAAHAEVSEVMRLRPDFSIALFASIEPYKLAADREHLVNSLLKAGLPE